MEITPIWLYYIKKMHCRNHITIIGLRVGGKYIASEKQVRSNLRISVLLQSCWGTLGGDDAKPTPASLETATQHNNS